MPVPLYILSPQAARHVDILAQVAEYSGQVLSRRTEDLLYATFNAIAAQPGLGHLRPDLVAAQVYFFYAKPYQVLYRKDIPIQIVTVFHEACGESYIPSKRPKPSSPPAADTRGHAGTPSTRGLIADGWDASCQTLLLGIPTTRTKSFSRYALRKA